MLFVFVTMFLIFCINYSQYDNNDDDDDDDNSAAILNEKYSYLSHLKNIFLNNIL